MAGSYLYTGATSADAIEFGEAGAMMSYIDSVREQQKNTAMARTQQKMLQQFNLFDSGAGITPMNLAQLKTIAAAIQRDVSVSNLALADRFMQRSARAQANGVQKIASVNSAIATFKKDFAAGQEALLGVDVLRLLSTMAVPQLDIDGLIKSVGNIDTIWQDFLTFVDGTGKSQYFGPMLEGCTITPQQLQGLKDLLLKQLGDTATDLEKTTAEDFKKSLISLKDRLLQLKSNYKQSKGLQAVDTAVAILDKGIRSFGRIKKSTTAYATVDKIQNDILRTLQQEGYEHYGQILNEVQNAIAGAGGTKWSTTIGNIGEYIAALMQDVTVAVDANFNELVQGGALDAEAASIASELLADTLVSGQERITKNASFTTTQSHLDSLSPQLKSRISSQIETNAIDPRTGERIVQVTFTSKVQGKPDTRQTDIIANIGIASMGTSIKTYNAGSQAKLKVDSILSSSDPKTVLNNLIQMSFPSGGSNNLVTVARLAPNTIESYLNQLFGSNLFITSDSGGLDDALARTLTESYIDELFGGTGLANDGGGIDWASKFVVNGFMVSVYDIISKILSDSGTDYYEATGTFMVPMGEGTKVSMAAQLAQLTYQVEINFGQALATYTL